MYEWNCFPVSSKPSHASILEELLRYKRHTILRSHVMWRLAWIMCIISVFFWLSRTQRSSALVWYYPLGWHNLILEQTPCPKLRAQLSQWSCPACRKHIQIMMGASKKGKLIRQMPCIITNISHNSPDMSASFRSTVFYYLHLLYMFRFFFCCFVSVLYILPGTLIFYRLYKHWVLLAYLVPLT